MLTCASDAGKPKTILVNSILQYPISANSSQCQCLSLLQPVVSHNLIVNVIPVSTDQYPPNQCMPVDANLVISVYIYILMLLVSFSHAIANLYKSIAA